MNRSGSHPDLENRPFYEEIAPRGYLRAWRGMEVSAGYCHVNRRGSVQSGSVAFIAREKDGLSPKISEDYVFHRKCSMTICMLTLI
ncbi:MAG: hypothetical protein LUQ36_00480 [Methanoregula sp.]|jgi:hypothetical protein|nr:hypothetical protein [Methanoregula sp.]